MNAKTSGVWGLLRQTFKEWSEDKVPRLGAALAFYTALSIAPLLVITLRVVALFAGDEAARGEIERQMQGLVGDEGGRAVQEMIENANKPESGTMATVLSVATLLFGASGVFAQLQDSLNTIWEVQPKPGRGVWGMIRDRFLSFAMVLGIAFLLLVSLVVSAALSAMGGLLGHWTGGAEFFIQVANFLVSFGVITLLFAMMFKLLPDVEIAWKDVWFGAAVTSLLFAIGKLGIGLYLGRSAMASSYGVAGSFVVLLVWVYYSAQIVFFGAELTQVYANRYGSRIVPSARAEVVPDSQRAQEGIPRSSEPEESRTA